MSIPVFDPEILELEKAAALAWPAETVVDLDGWLLRSMHGVTRRANSVWAGPSTRHFSALERIERAEQFYAERGQPSIFQLSPISDPSDLDRILSAKGYALDAPVAIEVADAEQLASVTTMHAVRVEPKLFDAWFEISAEQGRFAAVAEIYRGLLTRLGGRALFALAEVDRRAAAVGLGVLDGPRCGIFSMLTLEPYRRLGLAQAIAAALARHAYARGAQKAYVQVERENQKARALYRKLGFSERYGYHYRCLPAKYR